MDSVSSSSVPRRHLPSDEEVHDLLHAFIDSSLLMMGIVELLPDDILHIQDQPTTARFFGRSPGETCNRTAGELGVPPQVIALWLEHYHEADRTERPVRFEYQHHTPHGLRTLSVRVSRITGAGEEPHRFGYVIEDVTEQRQHAQSAEETRRSRAVERQAVAILESISDAFYSVDRQWRFTYVNREAERLLNASRAQLLGRSLWDAFPPARLTSLGREYERAMDEQVPVEFEEHFLPLDRWYHIRAFPVEDGLAVYFRDITENREADLARRQNQDFFQLLDEAIPDLVWVTDADFQPLYMNRHWHEYTGLALDDLAQVGYVNLYHPDDRERVKSTWEAARATGEPTESEVRYRRHDGTYRWFWRRAVPVKDGAGRVVRWVGVSTDLTERKALEESLHVQHEQAEQERRRLRAVLDILPVGLFLMDAGGRILEHNQAARGIWGTDAPLSPNPDAYDEDYKAWWPQTGKRLEPDERPMRRVLFGGEAIEAEELDIENREGQRKTILGYGRAILTESGAIDGAVAVNVDITDRKRMEQALRHNEEQLRLAVEGGRLATFILNPLTDEVLFQNNVHTLFGLPEPVKAVPELRAVIHTDDLERVRAAFRACAEHGSVLDVVFRVVLPDASIRWLQSIGHPYVIRESTVVAGIHMDVTQRKLLEETLREQAEALRAADRAKDEFLAMLGHELRNPLSAIANASQLLRMRAQKVEGFHAPIEILGRQVQQMSRLVEDLLEVSRITMGRMELRREPVDLVQVVRQAVEASAPVLEARGHTAAVSVPEGPVWLEGDTARLQQVVGNLLGNAAKFTASGGHIRVSLAIEALEAVLRVRDDGQGMAADLLPHVFGLFTQAETTLDRPHGGLGIGLALVKRIVEMHGGSVSAYSEGPGAGSEFVVRLPLSTEALDDGGAAGAEEPSAGGAGLHILIVEDEEDAAASLASLVELSGWSVTIAADGAAALEAAQCCQPDVVLLDIGLPTMNGYEVARHLRAMDRMRGTLIVAMTGYGQEQDREQSREAGMDEHLVKPVDFERLLALLREHATRLGPPPEQL